MDVYQRRRLVALCAIAAVFIFFVLLIRGCGGDDEEAQPLAAGASGASGVAGATIVSQADYAAQGDQICLGANTSLAGVDEADPVQADNDRADIVASELQQLQSLTAPDGGTDDLNEFLTALQTESAAYQDRATANERGDDAQVTELDATIDQAAGKAAEAAKAFGFEVCGDPSKVGESTGGGGGGGGGDTSEAPTDTGGTVTPTDPATPTTTTPIPTAPPTDTGGGTGTAAPAPAPPVDGGTDGSSSGGVSP